MKRQFNICNVIEGATLAELLDNMEKVQGSSSMIELRSDFVKDFKAEDVKKLASKVNCRSIFTCRNIKEGGKFSGSFDEQQAILKEAFKEKFDFVDVAFDNPFIESLSGNDKKKLLVSYHDFKETRSSIELKAVIERMRENSPAIIKIATMVNDTKDVFTLTDILRQKKNEEKLIVIGMGEAGKLTRVLFPMMGSYLTYASASTKIVQGIISEQELQTVFNILSK